MSALLVYAGGHSQHANQYSYDRAFNTGSPFSVPAGSVANIDKVIAHYEKKNYEEQASKVQAAKDETSK